ncbi:AAA family ATPase [Aquibacillus sp. 3ASR75-11]|uniref:AAA family ATPase n=1 Tax=Terrihalobacillus insolitus TaxID=2950438 RepID=A0A9X3WPC2_9BACI|nr:ATP-binding protein [Terrihalobacillus insolitus]MDC3411869.1 AAA family ATPase [Terrihalobacillus insolitus]MDC3423452.1 AAA family ATPase [Terrihalobacillus insolitus]
MGINLSIKHFKSIFQQSIELGKVNVFIGANGSGKSSLLEAMGVLSGAISGRVDNEVLAHRGVRLGTPALYKSSFQKMDRIPRTLELGIESRLSTGLWNYSVNLSNPIERPKPSWDYFTEGLYYNDKKIFGRSQASSGKVVGYPNFEVDSNKGWLSFLQGIHSSSTEPINLQEFYDFFKDYAIYTPNTATLRGIQPDTSQRDPLGLFGGRLAESVEELLDMKEELFGSLDIDDLYELIDWVDGISVGKPNKDMVAPGVTTGQKAVKFTDRYMRDDRNELTPYDSSEGSLFVLFVLILAMHERSTKIFAVDNFDQAMNPRLARKVTEVFTQKVIEHNKIALLTTHNPLVLDGLDISNTDIRLFAVERNRKGHTEVNRIVVTKELLDEGYSLSKLWLMGRLGGVPNL